MEEEVTLTSANVDDSVLTSNARSNSVDIMQILTKAKKDYNKVSIYFSDSIGLLKSLRKLYFKLAFRVGNLVWYIT